MFALLILVALDLAAPAPHPTSKGPLLVVPGKQLGPVQIGMSRTDLARLGARDEGDELTLGPLTMTLDGRGKVKEIVAHLSYEHRPRLQIGAKTFRLEWELDGGQTGDELIRLFSGCRKPFWTGEDNLWKVWRCYGARIEDRLADGDPEMNIFVH